MNTTIHPNDLFAPFTPDPDGQSWTLTTDPDGNILPASHDGQVGSIWVIRLIGERTYAITRRSQNEPERTIHEGRIWMRWFFRMLMINFVGAPKIGWGPKYHPKSKKEKRPASKKNHKGYPVDTAAIVALLPPEGASRPQWVDLGKAAGFGKTCVYKHIKKARAARIVVVASGGLFYKSPEKP